MRVEAKARRPSMAAVGRKECILVVISSGSVWNKFFFVR